MTELWLGVQVTLKGAVVSLRRYATSRSLKEF